MNPLGFHDATPAFSWKLPAGVKKQTAYRIQTKTGDKLWDRGWVESDQSVFVPYTGEPLVSRQQVEWKVDFRDENGRESGWSEPAHFELGLLSAEDWKAKWIRPVQESDPVKESVGVLRRKFDVTKAVKQARIYVTARGLFELTLNGQRVGRDHFTPGFTAYRKRLDTLTYDVTRLLRQGHNTLEGLLGAGWYSGRYPWKRFSYGKNAGLLAQLEVTYVDGSRETIASDETWEGSFGGPIVSSSLYDGEDYDARRQPSDWAPVIVETDLGKAALTPKPFAPVREMQALPAKEITQPQPGCFIFDLGQNMVGWARLKIPVEKDGTVTARFAEMLEKDGTLYTKNYRSAKSTDTYTAAQNGTVEWEPTFTFHGFRFVELSGLPRGVTPRKNWVTGVVLHTDFPVTGEFTSSHAKLNQLQSNIAWGWRGNAVDIPTDCPQRDERSGWTGDAQVFAATALLNTGSHAFWRSWLGSMRDEQREDGVISDVVPMPSAKWGGAKSPGWMDAATLIPWDLYVSTGDTGVLADNYEMMARLVGWYRSQSKDDLLPEIGGFGDWLQPYRKSKATRKSDWLKAGRGDTSLPLIGAAFYARSAQILADSARVLGRAADAKRYGEEAAAVRAAFVKQYFDADGKILNAPETQAAYALAIAFGLLPLDPKVKAGNHLARLVRETGGHLRTGFLGTPHLAPALDETGHGDLAADLLFQETYPSWFYSINQGATTMWERWDSYSHEKGFGDAAMNSFNHYAYGAIGQWMVERLAGLSPDPAHPGYKHFFIRPLIVKQLDFARAELETPYGKAVSAWAKRNGKIKLDIVVPPNTTATIEFPNGRKPEILAAGSYHLEIDSK